MKSFRRHSRQPRPSNTRSRAVLGALRDRPFVTLAAVAATIFALVSFAGAAKGPPAPTGLKATRVAVSSVTLNWKVTGSKTKRVSYDLFRDGVYVGRRWGSSHRFTNLTCGTRFELGIKAVATNGARSGLATIMRSTKRCTGRDKAAPIKPKALGAARASSSGVTLSWGASTDNKGVAGYEIWQGTTRPRTTDRSTYAAAGRLKGAVRLRITTRKSYRVTGLSCGTATVFAVNAYDVAGNRSPKAVVTAETAACPGQDLQPPSLPTTRRVTGRTPSTVTVAWSASTDNVGVAGYETWLDGARVAKTDTTTYTFRSLACGRAYTVGLVAFDAAGNRTDRARASFPAATATCGAGGADAQPGPPDAPQAPSPESPQGSTQGSSQGSSQGSGSESSKSAAAAAAAPATASVNQAPTRPTGLSVSSVGQTSLTFGWRSSSDDGGVHGYTVYRDGARIGQTSSTSYPVSGLSCGTSYTLAVEAYDAAGKASAKASLSATTAACPAPAPSSTPPSPEPAPAPAPAPPPAPASGNVLELSGSMSPSGFSNAVASKGSGALTVRPAGGSGSFTVTGDLEVSRSGLTIQGANVTGRITFLPGANGSSFANGSAKGFAIFGADDVTISGSTFDGQGQISNNPIWDQPAGSTPDRFRILDNTIKNFYGPTASDHSEGIFVGYSTDGLIQGNTFQNNGNTGHIFFSYWGGQASPSSSHPRNVCVRGNQFGSTRGAYFAVDIRLEIPSSTGIDVEPAPSNTLSANIGLSASNSIVRNC